VNAVERIENGSLDVELLGILLQQINKWGEPGPMYSLLSARVPHGIRPPSSLINFAPFQRLHGGSLSHLGMMQRPWALWEGRGPLYGMPLVGVLLLVPSVTIALCTGASGPSSSVTG